MSRPWMPLFIADYLADTGHLSCSEHGAYLLLIMHYWQRGCLPRDDRKLASIARAMPEQWLSIKPAVAIFFDKKWRHKRIDVELEKSLSAYNRRAEAGRKGGRKGAKQCLSNAQPSTLTSSSSLRSEEVLSSLRSDNKPQRKKRDRKSVLEKPSPLEILKTALSEKTAQDVIDHRKAKRAPLTPRAAELLVAAFRDHGEPEAAAEAMIANGWQGFKPEWMANKIRAGPDGQRQITAFNRPSMREHILEADRRVREATQKCLDLEKLHRERNEAEMAKKNDP